MDTKLEMDVLYYLGNTANELADVFQASEYFKLAIEVVKSEDGIMDEQLLMQIYFQLGICWLTKEQHTDAMQNFLESFKLLLSKHVSPELTDWTFIGKICLYTAKALKAISFDDLAKEYITKSIDASIKAHDNETNFAASSLQQSLQSVATEAKVNMNS